MYWYQGCTILPFNLKTNTVEIEINWLVPKNCHHYFYILFVLILYIGVLFMIDKFYMNYIFFYLILQVMSLYINQYI